MRKFNNFQRQETARWLLNISQAAAIAGAGGLLIPGLEGQVGITGGAVLMLVASLLYFLAMYTGKEVKDDK